MHRFFVPTGCIDGERVTLAGNIARQLTNVLRAHPGERIVVLDGSGWEHTVTLERVSSRQARGRVTERLLSKGEPQTKIILYQAALKADRFEFVLQKGTELGVSTFVPVFCARSVPRDRAGEWTARRYQRWQRIISEAAEQSHRGSLPELVPAIDFPRACEAAEGLALIAWEGERETGMRAALQGWKEGHAGSAVSVFTGPEGGFTQQEIEQARANGVVPVGLGVRILRAETAAIAAVAAIMYEFGELGG